MAEIDFGWPLAQLAAWKLGIKDMGLIQPTVIEKNGEGYYHYELCNLCKNNLRVGRLRRDNAPVEWCRHCRSFYPANADKILDQYVDILNHCGHDPEQEKAFRNRYASYPDFLRMLDTAKTLKGIYKVITR